LAKTSGFDGHNKTVRTIIFFVGVSACIKGKREKKKGLILSAHAYMCEKKDEDRYACDAHNFK